MDAAVLKVCSPGSVSTAICELFVEDVEDALELDGEAVGAADEPDEPDEPAVPAELAGGWIGEKVL